MFSQNLLSCLSRFYPWSRVTFLMPFNCQSSLRSYSTKKTFNCQSSLRSYSTKKPIPISYGQRQLEKRKTSFSTQNSYTMNPTIDQSGKKFKRKQMNPRNYTTEYAQPNQRVKRFIDSSPEEELPQSVSTAQGLREFFSHPLTWDRNNGYFNILLGLAIFGYCFCTTCNGEPTSKVAYEADKRK